MKKAFIVSVGSAAALLVALYAQGWSAHRGEATRAERSGVQDGAASQGVLEPQSSLPALQPIAAEEREVVRVASGDTESFKGAGRVQVWGAEDEDLDVGLLWGGMSGGAALSSQASTVGGWSFDFPSSSTYSLTGAQCSLAPLEVVGGRQVTPEHPILDLELITPSWTKITLVDEATGAVILGKCSIRIPPAAEILEGDIQVRSGPSRVYAGGAQVVRSRENPLAIRDFPIQRSIVASVRGYQNREFVVEPGARAKTVELKALRSLSVELVGGSSAFTVEAIVDEEVIHRSSPVVSPGAVLFDIREGAAAEIVVRAHTDLGRGPVMARSTVVLNQAGPTTCEVAPSEYEMASETGEVLISVSVNEGAESPRLWLASMYAVTDLPCAGIEPYPVSQVAGWDAIAIDQRYEMLFSGIEPGEYRLIMSPSGVERTVRIEAGSRSEVDISSASWSLLRVWPIAASSECAPVGGKLGGLAWMIVDAESAAEFEQSKRKALVRERLISEAHKEGRFQFAAWHSDGCWEIRTAPGVTLFLASLSPRSLRAEDQVVEIDSGPLDVVLRFKGI